MLTVVPKPHFFMIKEEKSKLSLSDAKYAFDENIASEGYEIHFDDKGLVISYSDEAGKFYAKQTIRQLLYGQSELMSHFVIKDSPEFSHRGFMIDCARHFFTVEELKRVIESAALMKFNRFHWHLTDDQGWRIEIKSHPELTEIGAKRKRSAFGDVVDESEYYHYFTQEEIKEIVAFCKERHIVVIPEIDMPGHTTALLACHNEFGCEKKHIEVAENQGIKKDVLCVSNKELVPFIKEVLDEVCELFPDEYIHIGGDETPTKAWENCPNCSGKKKELGLESYSALQGWFTKQITDYLKEKGKKAIVWNESLKGDYLSTDDVIVQHWLDKTSLSYDFANKGGLLIESDFPHYYFDYPIGMTSLKKAYGYVPYNRRLNSNGRKNVIGVECELWSEYIRSFDALCSMLYPRMLAVSETGWCRKKSGYKDFESRAQNFVPMLNSLGIDIIPKEKWNLPPVTGAKQTISFYKAFVTFSVIKEFFFGEQ